MTAVTVLNESGVPCDAETLDSLAAYLLAALRLHPDCELGITLVDVERMTTLHEDWMNEPGPTDVLSFPIDELRSAADGAVATVGILGDIVLCPAFALAQAAVAGRSLDEELQFLTTHGTLHLIGYEHDTEADYAEMFALQDTLLEGWRRP
ncbi:MAG: rRNA maturation RNase YbeY [Actinobacteria bacterium]|nr:rRNA maturation RNase YbeY [Actinomycetota bacterium]